MFLHIIPLLLIIAGTFSIGHLIAGDLRQEPASLRAAAVGELVSISPSPSLAYIATPIPDPTAVPTRIPAPKPTRIPTRIPTPTVNPTAVPVPPTAKPAQNLAPAAVSLPGGLEQDAFNALNSYRRNKGQSSLGWDGRLADYAKSRAAAFKSAGAMDYHAGIRDFINNQDGARKLGFYLIGENSGFNFPGSGVDIIERFFTGDSAHDANQLDSKWSHVGVGIVDNYIDFIFGGSKI